MTRQSPLLLALLLLALSEASSLLLNETSSEPPNSLSLLSRLDSALDFGTSNPFREFNSWLNAFFFSEDFSNSLGSLMGTERAYYALCYLRDLIAGTAVYWLTAGVWHFVIYSCYGEELFSDKKRPFPTGETIQDQMVVAQLSVFIYAALPVLSEFIIESGYTKVYFYISDVGGWRNYFLGLLAYVCCFEMGIYWMHRTLHTNKFLYKWLHSTHHKYNKTDTLTPWASIAFNPLDGILQASPYLFFLPVVPVHYFTHVLLLFFSGVWATNIHDSVPVDSEPIMGAAYHTIHHTHYHYNFGQWFIFCDYIFGTLRSRKDLEDMKAAAQAKKAQ